MFEKLNVSAETVRALKEDGITKPTQIQELAIPHIIEGKDVIGMSYTGSGKTVAFGVPVVENVKGDHLQTLILAPTRELAVQISGELRKFGKYKKIEVATVYGGVAMDPQIEAMSHSQIVVATPGRLLDHLQRRNVDLSQVRCFVLDEADKMVEMGFIEDVERILSQTPIDRQVVLFGATLSREIDHIKDRYMEDAVVAEAAQHVEKDLLEQFYYNVPHHQKFSLLTHRLKTEEMDRVIIFCSARSTVELVSKNLRTHGIKAEMIHGKMSQNKRLHVLKRLHNDQVQILVASAVAARGLDIRDITHVFNYDLSQDPQEYVHRIGRTARAGSKGKAFTLLSDRDYGTFQQILDHYRLDIKEIPIGEFPRLSFDARRPERNGFRGNYRGGNSRGNSNGNFRGQRNSGRSNSYKKPWKAAA